jgi:hypothetical protein
MYHDEATTRSRQEKTREEREEGEHLSKKLTHVEGSRSDETVFASGVVQL